MPKFEIQVDGETVAEFGEEVYFAEVKSSIGLLGEIHPEGRSRINIVTHKRPGFATHLEDVSPVPAAREPAPVEDEKVVPMKADDSGFKFPVE